MTPTPAALGGSGEFVAWRLDREIYAADWRIGEGAFQFGGRWNSPGLRAVYASLDPSTAILEVAVHKGLERLDTIRHTLLQIEVTDAAGAHVVQPSAIPNKDWLDPGVVSDEQREFGAALLRKHGVVLFPSVVSSHGWNVILTTDAATSRCRQACAELFSIDPRLTAAR